ncbi:hypothetical protein BDW59DRAFT_178208 [Aspergillus cavernicola]|uniref:TauD/TfdA-like domain-containing protein n=1 Tax=Aspergillus cavernicola TaxID=176166 RepID=A0ABR4HEA2_9EURO
MLCSSALRSSPKATTSIAAICSITGIPNIIAGSLNIADCHDHVSTISDNLEAVGVLKISLGFGDDDCQYLLGLIRSLNTRHSHNLPLTHSAHRGWFWDVKPSHSVFQCPEHQARSETMEIFPWHTDCSYEISPARFFALQVLHPDRRGGGVLSMLRIDRLLKLLSPGSVTALAKPEYRIAVPPEFKKATTPADAIIGGLLAAESGSFALRYREDIISPLTREAAFGLKELNAVLFGQQLQTEAVHLTPELLPERSIVIIDNRRWLHRRTAIKDPDRHLKRVRWDAKPFPSYHRAQLKR